MKAAGDYYLGVLQDASLVAVGGQRRQVSPLWAHKSCLPFSLCRSTCCQPCLGLSEPTAGATGATGCREGLGRFPRRSGALLSGPFTSCSLCLHRSSPHPSFHCTTPEEAKLPGTVGAMQGPARSLRTGRRSHLMCIRFSSMLHGLLGVTGTGIPCCCRWKEHSQHKAAGHAHDNQA